MGFEDFGGKNMKAKSARRTGGKISYWDSRWAYRLAGKVCGLKASLVGHSSCH